MNSNMTQYLALEKKFKEYGKKAVWWNIAQYGTTIGLLVTQAGESITAWAICLIAFILETVVVFTYLKKRDKILKEVSKL